MSYYQWDASLDIGVEAMNEEHKVLIEHMNAVYDQNAAQVSKEELGSSIQALFDYVIKHFADEEAYMASIDFAGLETHRQLHDNLLTELKRHIEGFANSDANQVSEQFIMFLKLWLTTHIRGIDMKYGNLNH